MTNWQGEPLCVVETKAVATVPFEEVSEEFAATEGEGPPRPGSFSFADSGVTGTQVSEFTYASFTMVRNEKPVVPIFEFTSIASSIPWGRK